MNKTAEVSFPLSPRLLLLLPWDKTAKDFGMLPREYVGDVNVVRAAHSDRYLFAHIGDKRIAKLAENYKNSRPAATTMGFGPDVFAPIKVARRSKDKRERVVKADR